MLIGGGHHRGMDDAGVACRQLGFSTERAMILCLSFESGFGKIWYTSCTSSEGHNREDPPQVPLNLSHVLFNEHVSADS